MQQGESQYGVPPPPSGIPGAEHVQPPMAVEAVSPISSRLPTSSANPEELTATVSGNFEGIDAGEDTERGGVPGNRWPREETLALIKIRSDMDAAFRDATLKGPLWEDVSRKLAEQRYKRSAKKCKEKFENVHKYYKRTKEGRTGRQDGKNYRFFSELEALHNSTTTTTTATTTSTPPSTIAFNTPGRLIQPTPLSSVAPPSIPSRPEGIGASNIGAGGISFSTNSSSSSQSDTDGDETEDAVGQKRKRKGSSGSGRKTMAFFKDLMKQLMDQQEEMQRKFLETIEKREQDRMIREEAWKRQEMARLSREHDAIARERDATASRDTAIIAFLQKITGQTIQLPQHPTPVTAPVPTPVVTPVPPPPPPQSPVQPRPQQQRRVDHPIVQEQQREARADSSSTDPASSRWPKAEVHALIKLRSGLDARYQDAGPKGPLWEEISAGMKQIGYNRSAKRCKEKWENINKYFKKVKESNKKRPEDAKTCPYFHQLDALYRKKSQNRQEQDNPNPQLRADVLPISTMPPPTPVDLERKNCSEGNNQRSVVQTSNGDVRGNLFEKAVDAGDETMTSKKPEDMMKEMMMENQCIGAEEDSDDMDEDEDEDEEEEKMAYKIEFQRPNGGGPSTNGTSNPSSTVTATAAGSFLAMVQ